MGAGAMGPGTRGAGSRGAGARGDRSLSSNLPNLFVSSSKAAEFDRFCWCCCRNCSCNNSSRSCCAGGGEPLSTSGAWCSGTGRPEPEVDAWALLRLKTRDFGREGVPRGLLRDTGGEYGVRFLDSLIPLGMM